MRRLLCVCRNDLRQRIRDRSALLLAFAAPFLVSAIIGMALSGAEEFSTTLAVADLDRSPVSSEFLSLLQSEGLSNVLDRVKVYETATDVEQAIADKEEHVGIVVPAGFAAALFHPKEKIEINIIGNTDKTLSTSLATALSEGFAHNARTLTIGLATAQAVSHGKPVEQARLFAALEEGLDSVALRSDFVDGQVKPVEFGAVSMAVLFLFLSSMFGATTILTERQEGTLKRLVASPARPREILGGKLLALYLLGVLQMGIFILMTSLFFAANWGDPLTVAVLTISAAGASLGVSAAILAFSRTEEQARGIGSMIVFTLALAGGQLTFGAVPDLLQSLASFLPNGQLQEGYLLLMEEGAGGNMKSIIVPLLATSGTAIAGTVTLATRWRKVLLA